MEQILLDAASWRLSARRADPEGAARGTIVALPGGSYNSAYWDHPRLPDASLLTLGAALGYRVVAVDRPGYGASTVQGARGPLLPEQADVLADLVNALGAEPGAGRGIFLIGHSMGGILSLMIAALRRTPALLGIDVSGVPHRYSDTLAEAVRATIDGSIQDTSHSAATLFYGPSGSYDPAVTIPGDAAMTPGPMAELEDSANWPANFPATAANVRVPVQFTLGEHETVTRTGWPALREIEELFTASPIVSMRHQLGAGHNISLHHVGRAYHLRALAFFDEILALEHGRAG